jgi:hypothetical protein
MNPVFLSVGKRMPSLCPQLYQFVKRLNSQPAVRPPLAPELRQRLQQELAPEVEHLSSLLGQNLMSGFRIDMGERLSTRAEGRSRIVPQHMLLRTLTGMRHAR